MDLVLKNCKTFYRGKIRCIDIACSFGKIASIGKDLTGSETINCKGFFVFPGLIDVHVHFRVPGAEHKEDWKRGSLAALHGGVTCVLDMPNNNPAIVDTKSLMAKKNIVGKNALVDYGLYLGASNRPIALDDSIREQIAGIKLYMSSASGELLSDEDAQRKAFEVASGMGKIIAVHAEDEMVINENKKKFMRKTISVHHLIRDDVCEAKAIEKAVKLAISKGASLHVCHVSSKKGLDVLLPLLKNGRVSCGVTPHHLFLTEKDAVKIGNKAKVNPSIKTRKDQAALIDALRNGLISVVETDHAPHTEEEKSAEYESAPSGMPGLETMLPLLLDAHKRKQLPLIRILQCCCENPAKIFGIGKKGSIEVGKDADFCVVDLKKSHRIRNEELFTKCGWSAFEGRKLRGTVEKTILRGTLCYENGSIVDSMKGFDAFGGD